MCRQDKQQLNQLSHNVCLISDCCQDILHKDQIGNTRFSLHFSKTYFFIWISYTGKGTEREILIDSLQTSWARLKPEAYSRFPKWYRGANTEAIFFRTWKGCQTLYHNACHWIALNKGQGQLKINHLQSFNVRMIQQEYKDIYIYRVEEPRLNAYCFKTMLEDQPLWENKKPTIRHY